MYSQIIIILIIKRHKKKKKTVYLTASAIREYRTKTKERNKPDEP